MRSETTTMFKIRELHSVFTDGFLLDDDGYLLFLSLWGRDTVILETMARMQLSNAEDGLDRLTIEEAGHTHIAFVPDVERLSKETRYTSDNTELGRLCHMVVFDNRLQTYDVSNRRAMLLVIDGEPVDPWPALKTICHIPLLDAWREPIILALRDQGAIRSYDRGVRVCAQRIEIPEGFEEVIRAMIENEVLVAA